MRELNTACTLACICTIGKTGWIV